MRFNFLGTHQAEAAVRFYHPGRLRRATGIIGSLGDCGQASSSEECSLGKRSDLNSVIIGDWLAVIILLTMHIPL
jgi:hypothetical protein